MTDFSAWHRLPPEEGSWNRHIHAIAIGDSACSDAAKERARNHLADEDDCATGD